MSLREKWQDIILFIYDALNKIATFLFSIYPFMKETFYHIFIYVQFLFEFMLFKKTALK